MRVELKAIARLTGVDLHRAARVFRKNPLLNEEVHMEESLVNLEESFAACRAAGETLDKYPKIQRHALREQRLILHHCLGAIFRILQRSDDLPVMYSDKEAKQALKQLVRLVTNETIYVRKDIDSETLEIIRPLLSWKQRLLLRYRKNMSPELAFLSLASKLIPVWHYIRR